MIELKKFSSLAVVGEVYDMLCQCQMEEQCMVISFQAEYLQELRRYSGTIPVQLIVKNAEKADVDKAAALGNSGIDFSSADGELIAYTHSLNCTANVWTVDQSEEQQSWRAAGIDFITTNTLGREKNEMNRRRKTVWISILLAAFLSLLPGCAGQEQRMEAADGFIPSEEHADQGQNAEDGDAVVVDSSMPELEAEQETVSEEERSDELLATLLFASDYQSEAGWPEPAETLFALMDVVCDEGYVLDNAILCDDYSNLKKKYNYETSPDESIAEIKSIFQACCAGIDPENMIFVQGNHDAMTEALSDTGLYEFDDYLVYVLNTQTAFPWKQGALGMSAVVRNAAENMKDCFDDLIAAGETRPMIIAGHVPLHFSARTSPLHTTGDNMYSSHWETLSYDSTPFYYLFL